MPDLEAKLDGTLNALRNGLTALATESALHRIEGWESELQAAAKPEFNSIARDLAALRTHLVGDLDGDAIGRLLLRLGQQTSTVAGQADEATSAKLHLLGDLLVKAGRSLASTTSGSTPSRGNH